MPQFTSITINPTAGDVVFSPEDRQMGVSTWREVAAASPLSSSERLSYSIKRPSANSQVYKIVIKFNDPVTYTDADTGIISNQFTNHADLTITVNKNVKEAELAKFVEHYMLLLGSSELAGAITKLENFY